MRFGIPNIGIVATWLAALFAAIPKRVFACPGCNAISEQAAQAEPDTVMAGVAFSWSVIFMLAVVLLIIGLYTAYVVSTVRRLDREQSGQ